MSQDRIHLSFYRFVRLGLSEPLPLLRARVKSLCNELQLRGTILLAPEGLNAMITGSQESALALRAFAKQEFGLQDKDFKEARVQDDSFSRMLVKIKKEIITVGDPELRPDQHTAPRISPAELKQWLDEKRPIVLLDTRNQYEVEVGTFAGAEAIEIDTSRDFASQASAKLGQWKDRPVVTFCTGGIRCEKGAALLLKLGKEDVFQLDGGILSYFEKNGAAHFEGNCFVFDQRMAVDGELKPVPRADDPKQSFGRHRLPNSLKLMIVAATLLSLPAMAKDKGDASVSLVIQQFKKYGKSITRLPLECLSFTAGESGNEVDVREVHNEKCGGDPETSPRVASFTIKKGKVFFEDPASGELKPFGRRKKSN